MASPEEAAMVGEGSTGADSQSDQQDNQQPAVKKITGRQIFKGVFLAPLMIAAMSACMMFSTLSTFSLAKNLNYEAIIAGNRTTVLHTADADFVALWLTLFIPPVVGFAQAMIKESLSSGPPSPKWSSIAIIMALSVSEVSGLLLFTFHVLPDDRVDISTAIVLMNGVLVGHVIHGPRCSKKLWWLISNIMILGGVVFEFVRFLLFENVPNESPLLWQIPLSLVLVSIAWLPCIQERQAQGKDDDTQTANLRATIAKNFVSIACLIIALFVMQSDTSIGPHSEGISVYDGFRSLYLRKTDVTLSVVLAFGAYVLGVTACAMCMQHSFLISLCLAPVITLIFALFVYICPLFESQDLWCEKGRQKAAFLEGYDYVSMCVVIVGQIICSIYNYIETAPDIHEKVSNIFWFPYYTGVFTGQHMLLNRTKIPENPAEPPPDPTDLRGRVMICTTMYRETSDEMSQYLKSIKKVAASEKLGKEYRWAKKFEAHVYFDNGVRGSKLTDFSAKLVCLVDNIFEDCTSENTEVEKTWYGWKLHWARLPGSLQLPLTIHLKDNQEVKSKKRWSQVMYMESAVDRVAPEDDASMKYILATDGDVDFDADAIEAMLLQMLSDREEEVGAVCARTHPVGSGPFVWYQKFDYAIGHWLQKVANHVLGSVLCAPGCFTVYRVEAVADVLEEYRSDVEEASDFLTKDMGKDRWFTTLLVKAGWKVNYCAGAADSTHCPEEFDEFWKQRRRWIPSTLANQILLLKNWKEIKEKNKYISMVFLLFQVILLLSTVISPSTCILIITGGLYYGMGFPVWLSSVFFILIILVFAGICIRCSQETQLKVARGLCFIFLLVMAVAVVGTASQIVSANTSSETPVGNVGGTYEGCFPEYTNSNDLLLPHAFKVMKDLTNVKCRDHCHSEGFDYSGTGFPAMCFC